MSEYSNDLNARKEHYEDAHYALESALSSHFIGHDEERYASSAKTDVEEALGRVEEEIALLNADWETVQDQAWAIHEELRDAEQMLVDAGVAERDEVEDRLTPTVDDPPETFSDLCDHITFGQRTWEDVSRVADMMMEDQ